VRRAQHAKHGSAHCTCTAACGRIPILVEGERLRPNLTSLLELANYVTMSAKFPQVPPSPASALLQATAPPLHSGCSFLTASCSEQLFFELAMVTLLSASKSRSAVRRSGRALRRLGTP